MMNWRDLKRHELNVYPDMSQEEQDLLKKSIQDKGFDTSQPIRVFQGPTDVVPGVIDGMQRLQACLELGVIPNVVQFYGTIEETADFIHTTNTRRNLEIGMLAIIGNELYGKAAELEAKASFEASQFGSTTVGLNKGQPSGRASQMIADKMGISRDSVNKGKAILNYSPTLAEAVKQGKISLAAAYNQVQERKADNQDPKVFMERRAKTLAKQLIQQAIDDQLASIESEILDSLKADDGKKFNVVLTLKQL